MGKFVHPELVEGSKDERTNMLTFWLYMLECSDGSYIGHTDNLEKRIMEHEFGITHCYTFSRRPVKLVYSEEFASRYEALASERQIKGWSRAKKKALINRDWDEIKRLAGSKHPSTSSG